jgi:hypothetical protein
MTERYRPGVLSRVLAWAGTLPGRGWWLYPLLYALLFTWSHGIVWLTGQVPIGAINPLLAVGVFYMPYTLAAIAYINRSSEHALATFWPATGWPVDEREEWRWRFVMSPGRLDVAALGLGVAVAVVAFLSASPDVIGAESGRVALFVAYLPTAASGYAIALLALIHTTHQLRLVARIHREATAIDPFDRVSLYAFSALTVRTGLAYVLSGYYTLVFNGGFQAGNVVAIIVLGAVFAVGLACFVLPLWGIHGRLVREKQGLARAAEARLGRLVQEFDRRIEAGQFEASKTVADALAGAADIRRRVLELPTWPWRPQLFSGFVSALLLPVAVYLLTRVLASQLGQ